MSFGTQRRKSLNRRKVNMSDWKEKPLRNVGLVEGWARVGLCDQQHTAEGMVCHVRDQRVKDAGFFIPVLLSISPHSFSGKPAASVV